MMDGYKPSYMKVDHNRRYLQEKFDAVMELLKGMSAADAANLLEELRDWLPGASEVKGQGYPTPQQGDGT